MITRVSIDGYKCLKDCDLAVGNMNVLVGSNASGKSSVLQLLLLLRQSANNQGSIETLHLSGQLFEAGIAQDILHPQAEHRLRIRLEAEGDTFEYSFVHNRDSEEQSQQRQLVIERPVSIPPALNNRQTGFAYLNAERLGPRVTYALPPDEMHLGGLVGKYGEYTAAVLARASLGTFLDEWDHLLTGLADAPKQLDNYDLTEELGATNGRFDLVCNSMLGWIIPGAQFRAEEYDQNDLASLRFIRDRGKTNTEVRATHIGFGLTYTLPIIAAALGLKPHGLLMVENPEAHLHPFSQSRMGVFLAMMAATGRQIIVETHSDHVINGIRLAVRYNLIPAEQVYINSFHLPKGSITSNVTQIRPRSNGRLDQWPEGFFDQIESDLSKL